jgi:hypothetical protein
MSDRGNTDSPGPCRTWFCYEPPPACLLLSNRARDQTCYVQIRACIVRCGASDLRGGFAFWRRDLGTAREKEAKAKLQEVASENACLQQMVALQKAKECSVRLGSLSWQRAGALGE